MGAFPWPRLSRRRPTAGSREVPAVGGGAAGLRGGGGDRLQWRLGVTDWAGVGVALGVLGPPDLEIFFILFFFGGFDDDSFRLKCVEIEMIINDG